MSSSGEETSPKLSDNDIREDGVHQYTRELGGGYFPSRKNTKDQQFIVDPIPETQKPYNEWKTENRHLFSLQDSHFNRPLISNLGQNIQQMNAYIPNNPVRDSNLVESNFIKRYENPVEHRLVTNLTPPHNMMENRPNIYMPVENPHYNQRYTRANYDSPNFSPRYMQSPDVFPKQRIHNQSMPNQNFIGNDYLHPYGNWTSPKPQFLNRTCPCDTKHSKHKEKETRKAEKLKNKQISDLYRIVWLQNEQLAMLQNQVRKLIELNLKNEDSPQKQEQEVNKKYIKGTKEMRTFNLSVIEENQNITEKVSVGIMTSFIENGVAKIVEKDKKKPKKKKEESSESTSSDSSDSSEDSESFIKTKQLNKGKKKPRDDSFTLNGVEIPTVIDNIPSPQNSFHLDMQDYNSSSSETDESDTTESESEDEKPVGWTFYDNVVGKVNNMLKKPDQSSDDEIRNATLDQLKKLGISFVEPDNSASKRVTFGHGAYKEIPHKLHADSDTSMRMNALASKYLSAETSAGKMERSRDIEKPQSNTNLSFATMRYLERYRLVPHEKPINEESEIKKSKTKKKKKSDVQKTKKIKSSKTDKILDITAIKQQPKLLPKKM